MAGNALSPRLPWDLANPKWAASINPVLSNPLINGRLLNDIPLISGVNVVNHSLGRALRGYLVVLNSAAVTFYDRQGTNQRPDLTLELVSSGPATVSLYVF